MPSITKEYYHNIDLLANQLLNSRLHNITTAARIILGSSLTPQQKGYQVYDTDLLTPFYWSGYTWSTTSAVWGNITGTLSNQTDLQTALNAKFDDPTGTTSEYVRGDGSIATFPTVPSFTPSALTKTNDTNVTLTLGGAPSTALLQAVSLTLGWTGTLADSRISSASTWNAKQDGLSGTGIVKSVSGTISYITDNSTNWNTAYTNRITTLTTTGSSGSATLSSNTLNIPTYTLSGLGGEPIITAGTTSQYWRGDKTWQTFPTIPTVGTWGALNYPAWTSGTPFVKMTAAGTFSLDTSTYLTSITSSNVTTALGYTPVTNARTLTINGTTYDLTANRTWSVGSVTSVSGSTGMNFTTITGTGSVAIDTTKVPYYSSGFSSGLSKWNGSAWTWDTNSYLTSAVTSVGLTMPSAFNVGSSPVTGIGTLAVTAAGLATQYIRGDGVLADFPTNTGGGSVVNYYLNGSISQGTIGGDTYYQMSKTPVIGGGTNFNISTNGYIGYFITDALDPSLLSIPAGSWNFKIYMSANSAGGTPSFYLELYKYNGSTFTFITDNSPNPEMITGGTSVDLYYTSIAVPQTTLLSSDRLAIRIYVNNSGKTITLHTENDTLAQVSTTFSTGLTALNGSIAQVQYFSTGTANTNFNIDSSTTPGTHIFNLPVASDTNTGKLSNTDYTTFNNKASKGFAVAMAAAL